MVRRLPIALWLCLACARAPFAGIGLRPDGHLDTAAIRDAYLRSDIPAVRAVLEGFVKSHPKEVPAAEKVFTHLYLGASYAGEPDGRAKAEAHFRAALKIDPYSDPADLYLPPAGKTRFEVLRAEALRARAETEHPSAPAPASGASDPASGAPAPGAVPAPSSPAPSLDRPSPPPRVSDSAPDPASRAPAPASGASAPASGSSLTAPGPRPPEKAEAFRAAAGEHRGWLYWTVGGAAALASGAGVLAWMQYHSDPAPRRVQVDATLK